MSKLFCFIGPSGSGKSTIQHMLTTEIKFLTHYATRELRNGEIDGYHIKHVTRREFFELEASGELATKTEYSGNLYGAPKMAIWEIQNGIPYHATATIDNANQFKNILGNDRVVVIYIKPPNINTLKIRMENRGDDLKDIEARASYTFSAKELENETYADYVIVNDNLRNAILEAEEIIRQELKRGKENENSSSK